MVGKKIQPPFLFFTHFYLIPQNPGDDVRFPADLPARKKRMYEWDADDFFREKGRTIVKNYQKIVENEQRRKKGLAKTENRDIITEAGCK